MCSGMTTTRNAALWTLTAATLAATGCATAPEATSLPQGLTVLEAEAGTLSLAYREADVTIFMEARRGHETPEPYASAPDMPDFEIDTIFTDEAGYAFYTRMGGDGWVEPSWETRLAGQGQIAPPVGDNSVLFRLAGEAADVMHEAIEDQLGRDGAAAFEPEVEALFDFASHAPGIYTEELEVLNAHNAELGNPAVQIPDLTGGDVAYGTPGPCGNCGYTDTTDAYYYIRVGKADLWYSAGLGEHSATSLYRWTTSWLRVHDATNHGSAGSTMGQKCLFQYYDTTVASDWFTNIYQGYCAGNYEWDSDGSTGGHNCHDDTRTQLYNFYYGSSEGVNGTMSRWCNGGDDDTDISVWVFGVELDQNGSPDCSTNCERGVGFCP
jgi:hypothetical protein